MCVGGGVEVVLTLIQFITIILIPYIVVVLTIALTCLCLRCFYLLNYPDTLTRPPAKDAFLAN